MRKLQTKLKKLTNRSWSVSWEYRILKIRQLIVGWINYYRIENFMGVCRKLDKQIKFRDKNVPLEEVEDEQKQGKATNKIRSITMASKDLGKLS